MKPLTYTQPIISSHPHIEESTNTVGQGLPLIIQQGIATLMLLLLSPLMLLVMLAIRLESKGSAIFTQTRVGEQGQRFQMYKLRSMYCPDDPKYIDPAKLKSDRDGVCNKFFNDPRITRTGRFIRKLSLDEVPQLINVMKGEMALIGPRPALPQECDRYQWYMLERFNAKAGITGLWQVSGRADTSFEEQMALDLKYVRERTLWMDIKIIFATVPAVIFGKGAY